MITHSPRRDGRGVAPSATPRHGAFVLTALALLVVAGFLAWLLTVGVPVATVVLLSGLTLVGTVVVVDHLLG